MNTDDWFPPFKYDLDLDVEIESDREVEFPVELMEVDTSFEVSVPTELESPSIHETLYTISLSTPTTLEIDPVVTLDLGGSENFLGGSENLG